MSMADGKANFVELLADQESRVIALSGTWGSGKSHMWREVQKESADEKVKDALYLSLFGVATIVDLKLKLAQSAIPLGSVKGPKMDAAIAAFKTVKQVGKSLFSGVSALDELALLAVPALVRNRFIVVDDIERKHAKLAIDEILGFIDDFTQNYGCRILLILNTDQLSDKRTWDTFREKVIDQELRLDTSPDEAFAIAIQLTPSTFSDRIRPAVEACGLTNIRIIRKVIRAVNRILAGRSTLPNEVLDRLIPSTTLLAAIHYNGIEGGPSTEFVLALESSFAAGVTLRERKRQTGDSESGEDKMHARWKLLLQTLGIHSTDEYENLVADYLRSGLFDRSKVDKIVDRYLDEERMASAQTKVRAFFQTTIWQPDLTEAEVLDLARLLLPDVAFLDPYSMTSLHNEIVDLPEGDPVAREFLEVWVRRLHERARQEGANPEHFVLDNFFNRPLHPDIVTAFEQAKGTVVKPRSLVDVVIYLAHREGWSPAEEVVMQSASVDDFMQAMLSNSGDRLRTFLLKSIDILANGGTYGKHFGTASANFLEACKRIRIDRSGTRWAKLIKNLFEDSRLGPLLDSPTPVAMVAPVQ